MKFASKTDHITGNAQLQSFYAREAHYIPHALMHGVAYCTVRLAFRPYGKC